MFNFMSPPSPAPMRPSIHLELAPSKKGIKPEHPPQDVDKSHLSDSTSTTITLNETCHVNTSCDHLLHLDPPSTVLTLSLFMILKAYFSWILPVSHLSTHPALKLHFFLNLKDIWIIPTFHQ